MRTTRYMVGVLLLAANACLLGCRHIPEGVAVQQTESVWAGYGEPEVGNICVFVDGDVKHSGRYYLKRGANLESVYYAFGGWGGCGDAGLPPPRVVIVRRVGERKKTVSYPVRKMTKREREAVKLKDGDTLRYLTAIY